MERLSRFQFVQWLRTGRVPVDPEQPPEVKFNPNHDPKNGQFTFAGQGVQSGSGSQPSPVLRTMGFPVDGGPNPQTTKATPKPQSANPHRQQQEGPEKGRVISNQIVEKFKERMIPQENDRNDVYPDSREILTVGIGHKVVPSDGLKLGDRISEAQKEAFWREDSAKALEAAAQQMKEAGIRDPDFILPLADVNFQLGRDWRASFKRTWALIKARNYEAAAREVRSSKWYEQTPKRVKAFQSALITLSNKQKSKGR